MESIILDLRECNEGMSCEEYTLLMIAGPSNIPRSVRRRMERHQDACEYHQSKTFNQSALGTPVTKELELETQEVIDKYDLRVDCEMMQKMRKKYGGSPQFMEGRAAVRLGYNRYIYIDKKDRPINDGEYEYAGRFSDGRAAVKKNGEFFHIRRDGTPAYRQRFRDAADFRDGKSLVCLGNDKWVYIDKHGVPVSEEMDGTDIW